MQQTCFPVIDPVATGENILRLRKDRGLSVRDIQAYFGFEEPRAIYKWQRGTSLPTVDNLYALSALLEVPMDEILVSARPQLNLVVREQQASACCSVLYMHRMSRIRQNPEAAQIIFAVCGTALSPGGAQAVPASGGNGPKARKYQNLIMS